MSPIDTYNFQPSFIKIDAEGSEVEILKGSFNTLKMHKPFLQIENDTVLENNPIIDSMLFDLGYKKIDLDSFNYMYPSDWDMTDSYFLHGG